MSTFFLRFSQFFIVFIAVLFSVQGIAKEEKGISTLDTGLIIFSTDLTPPNFNKANTVSLPHNWDKPGIHGTAWYQFNYNATRADKEQVWAIYLPEVVMTADIWLNGNRIGSAGSQSPPVARRWHSPLMFSFPASLLQEDNVIQIKVAAYMNEHGKLAKIVVGPETALRGQFELHHFKAVTLNAICGLLVFSIAILLFIIWLKRGESEYFWFATACLMWGIYSANIVVYNIIISEEYWEKIVFLCSGWLGIAVAFLLVRLDNKYYPKPERFLLILCAFWSIFIFVAPEEKMFSYFPYWLQLGSFTTLAAILHLFWFWLKNPRRSTGAILVLISGIAVAGLHDVADQSGWIDSKTGLWLDFSLPLFFIIMSYILVSRFLLALQESEKLNQELEGRANRAEKKILQNYQEMLALETNQAADKERQRIHRDLHDSLGAKLLSLVYRSENNKESELARSALNDLRSIVQQSPVVEKEMIITSLMESIYEWEEDCINRCSESNKQLEFHILGFSKKTKVAMKDSKTLQAILSEALTNSIKHGLGEAIKIVAHYRAPYLKFSVKDNSDYSQMNDWQQGCGMENMQYRIAELKGKIKWSGNAKGGQVSWILPLNDSFSDR